MGLGDFVAFVMVVGTYLLLRFDGIDFGFAVG
jgi:hypothetical protein